MCCHLREAGSDDSGRASARQKCLGMDALGAYEAPTNLLSFRPNSCQSDAKMHADFWDCVTPCLQVDQGEVINMIGGVLLL